jgi:hypothetical protein
VQGESELNTITVETMIKSICKLLFFFSIGGLFSSCSASYQGAQFVNPEIELDGDYYVMTKDEVKHSYSGIDASDLIKKKKFVLSESESYPVSEVIGYKAIYSQYGRKKNVVKVFRKIEGLYSARWVKGRINVYNWSDSYTATDGKAHGVNKFFAQKGESGPMVQLIPQNGKKELYEMMKDYEPSKLLLDEYIAGGKTISIDKIVKAINTYNNR